MYRQEHHTKMKGKHIGTIVDIFGNLYAQKLRSIILPRSELITFRFAYGRNRKPFIFIHFHGFGIFGRVPEPHNQLFLSLETPGYLTKFRNKPGAFYKYTFCKLKTLQIVFWKYWKRWAPTNPDDPSDTFLKILDARTISS